MNTKRLLAAAALAGLVAMAGAWQAAAAEMSMDAMTKAFVFPEKPAAGTTLYGATYYADIPSQQRGTDAPQYYGWCIVAEEGSATFLKQSKTPQKRAFRVWYVVSANSYFAKYANADYLPGQPGKYKEGQRFLDRFSADNSSTPFVTHQAAIGDGAVIGDSPFRTLCRTTAGGLNITVDVICHVQIGGGDSINPTDVAKILTTKTYDGEWSGGAGLVQRFQSHHARCGEVAEGIARQIVAAWQQYANRKVGPGPDFKGLYLDVRPYTMQPKDMPQGFRCTNWNDENFRQVMANPMLSTSTYYLREANTGTATYAAEALDISIILKGPHFQKPIDHVFADAHDEFLKQPSTAAKTVAQPLTTLRGADEAKTVRIEGDADRRYVVARRANAVITIQGSLLRGEYAEQTLAMAQRVLDRFMAGDKGPQPEPSGPARIQLVAEPAALWAGSGGTARIRLTATDASGRGLPGKFTLSATGDGALRDAELSTNASGAAETVYTAGTRPGTATITATSPAGSAKAEIAEGGLSLAPEKPGLGNLLADGTSAIVLIVRGTGLGGKALAGQAVQLAADESRLPARGTLEPQTVTLAADGTARVTYRAPAISPTTGFRMDNIYVSATAAAAGGAALRSDYRVQVYAGEVAYLVFEKTGFVTGIRWPVAMPGRNATVRGKAQGQGYSLQQAPLAYAKVYAVFGTNPQPQAVGKTDAEGNFAVGIVGDPMSQKQGEVTMPDPLIINLDADFARALTDASAALKALKARGVAISGPSLYLYRLPVQVAVANPDAKDAKDTPQGLRNIGMRMARQAEHVHLIYERQVEDLAWFMESAAPVIEQMTEMFNVMQELEKIAKEKLGAQFDEKVWTKMKRTTMGRFLRTLNAWQQRNTYTLRQYDKKLQTSAESSGKLRGAVGAEAEDEQGLPSWGRWLLHWSTNPADAALKEAQKASGTDDTVKSIKTVVGNTMNSVLRESIETDMKAHASQLLEQAGKMAEAGEVAADDFTGPAERAKTLFAEYQSRHDKVNLANLDREIYRLNTKLFVDTVVKGVYIYVNIKDFAAGGVEALRKIDREKFAEIQKSVTEGGDKVNTAAKYLDAAFEAYKGKFWLDDLGDAAAVMDEVDKTLLRQGTAAP